MTKSLLTLSLTFCLLANGNTQAASIFQCEQPDGTIEFTNQGCSKSNSLYSKRTYTNNFTQANVTLVNNKKAKKKRRSAPFTQSSFVHLQSKLLNAQTLVEMEEHAQIITDKISSSAQQGKLNADFDMVAATYAKLSKYMKKKQWEGQSVAEHTSKIRTLFEEILITQSTVSTSSGLELDIEIAWKNYQANHL